MRVQSLTCSLAKTHSTEINNGGKTPKLHIFVDVIDNKLIKHENKFNRKVFHEQENSESQFSEFSCFMKGYKKYMTNISQKLQSFTRYLRLALICM